MLCLLFTAHMSRGMKLLAMSKVIDCSKQLTGAADRRKFSQQERDHMRQSTLGNHKTRRQTF